MRAKFITIGIRKALQEITIKDMELAMQAKYGWIRPDLLAIELPADDLDEHVVKAPTQPLFVVGNEGLLRELGGKIRRRSKRKGGR